MRILIYLLAVMLVGASAVTVRLAYFTVEQDNGALLLSWETEAEEDVRTYELFRRTSQSTVFTRIAETAAHGAGTPYTFRDDQVYKISSEMIDYRLEVVYESGLRQQLAERKVNYTPTAIRRSWGSIKAMFGG